MKGFWQKLWTLAAGKRKGGAHRWIAEKCEELLSSLLNFCKRSFSQKCKMETEFRTKPWWKNEFSQTQQSWTLNLFNLPLLETQFRKFPLLFGVFNKHTLKEGCWPGLQFLLDVLKGGSCVPTLRVTPSFKGHTHLSFKKKKKRGRVCKHIQPTDP